MGPMSSVSRGSAVAALLAAGLTGAAVLVRGDGGAPWWTAAIAGGGAAFLAAVVVLMRDGNAEDVVKALVLSLIAVVLAAQGVPEWMAWPLFVGPWTGWALARMSSPAGA